ncbi:TetR/AcrR family transcriptional regulator [Brachybacterium hainanense]|uniref:TetR/AcrR family transcriptional regulator n=1 Tax=Brachybacterium hainanense TaxID=1541174 RepID=A0ABV6REP2_9MICO
MTTIDAHAAPERRRRGRPRGQDSAVVRDAALRAAVDLIARQGYSATSMTQVAEAAGISPSGLVHHFPSKAALLGAVLAHRDEIDSDPTEPDGRPWAAYDHLVRVAGLNMRRRGLVMLYTSMIGEAFGPEHPAHEWMMRHYSSVLEVLIEGMRADQERGVVRADAPREMIARSVVALMDGLQVQWLIDESLDMEAMMRIHVDALKTIWGVPRS